MPNDHAALLADADRILAFIAPSETVRVALVDLLIRRLADALHESERRLAITSDELHNIATANPRLWNEECRDATRSNFEEWAKSRARHVLSKVSPPASPNPFADPLSPDQRS